MYYLSTSNTIVFTECAHLKRTILYFKERILSCSDEIVINYMTVKLLFIMRVIEISSQFEISIRVYKFKL